MSAETTKAAENHALANAEGWLSTIREYAACLNADRERLEELRDERDGYAPGSTGPDAEDADEIDRAAWTEANPDDAAELADLESAVTIDGQELDADECRERIAESPLSVEVRSDWHTPGDEDAAQPAEYMILLSTGGPALRIVGDLSQHCEPTSARLEYQDWGTPWTEYIVTGSDHYALMTFVGCFYFGG